jgi:hypothetical protein
LTKALFYDIINTPNERSHLLKSRKELIIMMKYVVCGNSVEDVQNGVEALKMAVASGATCGVGGSTMAEVEQGLEAMKQMIGDVAPTPKACLHPSCDCPCPCCDCEDEDEEIDYQEGYMALAAGGEELSSLHNNPEDAMVDAIEEGYDLDEIYICKVEAYEGGIVVIDILYGPNK